MNPLRTRRLMMRELVLDDAPFILELLNDPDWLRYIGDRGVRDLDAARDYIRNGPQAMYRSAGFGLYLVERTQDQAAIGLCGLLRRDSLEDVDLGFAFLPAFRSQGYAFEAAAAILEYAFGPLAFSRIVAITVPYNAGSIGLLRKLGMQPDGTVTMSGEELCLFSLQRPAALS